MVNGETLYLNKEVAEIVGVTKRQVLSWTEKGLVIPAKESPGAGTKRGYDYINLLEFGLCKTLFKIGLGFRAVKKFLEDLRNDGTIKDWANDWRSYYRQLIKYVKKHWSEEFKNETPEGMQKRIEEMSIFLETYEPQKPEGVIAYFAGSASKTWIIPLGVAYTLDLNALKEGFSESDNCLLINLGKIRANIDEKL
jgi:DNA-binding transcriptional MerR regulator